MNFMLYTDFLKLVLIFLPLCLFLIIILVGLGYRKNKLIFWYIIIVGMVLPWIVGIIIKMYLDSQGKSTYPWSYFLNIDALVFLLPLTLWFAIPFILLAFLHRIFIQKKSFAKLNSYTSRLMVTVFSTLGGIIGVVITFTGVFWKFDMIYFFIPLWVFYLPTMVLGLFGGILAGQIFEKTRNRT
jgi:hypothetical protein